MISLLKKIYWHVYVYTTEDIPNPLNGPTGGQIGTLSLFNITGSENENIFAFKNCSSFRYFNLTIDANNRVTDESGVRANDSNIAPGKIIFNIPFSDLVQLFGEPKLISDISEINLPQNRKPLRYVLFATYSSVDQNCNDRNIPDGWFSYENVPEEIATGTQSNNLKESMKPFFDLATTGLNAGFFFKLKESIQISNIGCCNIEPQQPPSSSSSSPFSPSSSSSSPSSSSSSSPSLPSEQIRERSFDLENNNFNSIWIVRQSVDNRINSHNYSGPGMPAELLRGVVDQTSGFDVYWEHAGFINYGEQNPLSYDDVFSNDSLVNSAFVNDGSPKSVVLGRLRNPLTNQLIDVQDIFWDSRGFLWAYCSGEAKDSGTSTSDGIIDITETTEGIYRLLPGGYTKTSFDTVAFGSDGQSTNDKRRDIHSENFFGPKIGAVSKIACGDDYFTCMIGNKYGELKFSKTPKSQHMTNPPPDVLSKTGIKDVASGFDHACIVDSNGSLAAWGGQGENRSCVLGPNETSGSTLYIKVACGDSFTVAIDNQNNIKMWADDTNIKAYVDLDPFLKSVSDYATMQNLSYQYTEIKAKGRMVAVRIMFTPTSGGETFNKLGVLGENNEGSVNVGFSADTSEQFDNTFEFAIDVIDFSCGYHNFAYLKSSASTDPYSDGSGQQIYIWSDGKDFGDKILLNAPTTGIYNKICLSEQSVYLVDKSQSKVSHHYDPSYEDFIDVNNNDRIWKDSVNSYYAIDCAKNYAVGQSINGYYYKYNYARLVERSIIESPINKLHPIAKLLINPVDGLPVHSKFLDGASFYRDGENTPSDVSVANMPLYIDTLKTVRNFQWMFKPYKVVGHRLPLNGQFESHSLEVASCYQGSGSLMFSPLHYVEGVLQNDGFDQTIGTQNFQASSKTHVETAIIKVRGNSAAYTIEDNTAPIVNSFSDFTTGIQKFMTCVGGSESCSLDNGLKTVLKAINWHQYGIFDFSDKDYLLYSKIVVFKRAYKIYKLLNNEQCHDIFEGIKCSYLSGNQTYNGFILPSKIININSGSDKVFEISPLASNGQPFSGRENFRAGSVAGASPSKSTYLSGEWSTENSSLIIDRYLNGSCLPFNVHSIKYCVPESDFFKVASRFSFEDSGVGTDIKQYLFSMKWRDHLGTSENKYIEDQSGIENTNPSQENCYLSLPHLGPNYFDAAVANNPVVYVEYTDEPNQDLTKMKVIKGRSYGCILDYGFDSCEIADSSEGGGSAKEISVCSKVMSVCDLIFGFWRISPTYNTEILNPYFENLYQENINSAINYYTTGYNSTTTLCQAIISSIEIHKILRPSVCNKCFSLAYNMFARPNFPPPTYATTPVRDFIYTKTFVTFEFKQSSGQGFETSKKYSFSKFDNFSCFANSSSLAGSNDFFAIDLREIFGIEAYPAAAIKACPMDSNGFPAFGQTHAGIYPQGFVLWRRVGGTQNLCASDFFAQDGQTQIWTIYGWKAAFSNISSPTSYDSCLFKHQTAAWYTGYFGALAWYFGQSTPYTSSTLSRVGIARSFVGFGSIVPGPNGDQTTIALFPEKIATIDTGKIHWQDKIISKRLIERSSKCILLKTSTDSDVTNQALVFVAVNRIYAIKDSGDPFIKDDENWNSGDYYYEFKRNVSGGIPEPLIVGDGVKIEFKINDQFYGFIWAEGNLYRIRRKPSLAPGLHVSVDSSVSIKYDFNLDSTPGSFAITSNSERIQRNTAHIKKSWEEGNLLVSSCGQYLVIVNCISTNRTQGAGSGSIYNDDIKNYVVVYKITPISSGASYSIDFWGFAGIDSVVGGCSFAGQQNDSLPPQRGHENSANVYSYSASISEDGREIFISGHKIADDFEPNSKLEPIKETIICLERNASTKRFEFRNSYKTRDEQNQWDGTTNLKTNPIQNVNEQIKNSSKCDSIIQCKGPDVSSPNKRRVIVSSFVGFNVENTPCSFLNHLDYDRTTSTPEYIECENLFDDDSTPPTEDNTKNSAYSNLNFWCATPISSRNGSQSAVAFENDAYVTSGGHAICLAPVNKSNNWVIKSISSLGIPLGQASRLSTSFANISEATCNNLSGCSIDNFQSLVPPDVMSSVARNNTNIVRSMVSIDNQKMIGLSHYFGSANFSFQSIQSSLFERLYKYVPYLSKLNNINKDGEDFKFNPSLRLFVSKFDPFTSPNSNFGFSAPLSINSVNYINMLPDFNFSENFEGYGDPSGGRTWLNAYMGVVKAVIDHELYSSCVILPRFGRDLFDKEGSLVSLVSVDVGAMCYLSGIQSGSAKKIIVVRDLFKTNQLADSNDSDISTSSILPNSVSDKSILQNNIDNGGMIEVLNMDQNDILSIHAKKNNIFNVSEAMEHRPLIGNESCITRGGCGSSNHHMDISKQKSNPFGFTLYNNSSQNVSLSPVGIFIDQNGFDSVNSFVHYIGRTVGLNDGEIKNFIGVPNIVDANFPNNIFERSSLPLSSVASRAKYEILIDYLASMIDPFFGEIYKNEQISISVMQSLRDKFDGVSGASIFGYDEGLSANVFLKTCISKGDLNSIRSWMSSKLNKKLSTSLPSDIFYCLDKNSITDFTSQNVEISPMTDVNIIPNKYKNIVIITAAEDLNINENYWGYSAGNRISWVEKIIINLRNNTMTNDYYQIHIVDFKPGRGNIVETEIIKLLSEKSGGTYIPVLLDTV
jgi:hypothetical protein